MRVHIGGDHAAYELLGELVSFLEAEGHEVTNHGPHTLDPEDDYPVFVLRAAEAVAADPDSLGVVLGGAGHGGPVAAQNVAGHRGGRWDNNHRAPHPGEHNNAQVISIGGRMNTVEEATAMVAAFLATPFSSAPRHQRRIDMVSAYEESGTLPPTPDPTA